VQTDCRSFCAYFENSIAVHEIKVLT
jgi:hypothetical protein